MGRGRGSETVLTLRANDVTAKGFRSFNANLEAAGRRVRGVEATMMGLGGAVDAVHGKLGLISGLASGGALGLLGADAASGAKEVLSYANALAMSTEVITGWQYAANDVGIQADGMANIFKDLNEKVGEAFVSGTGEAAEALDLLSLSAADLVKVPADQKLLKIGEAIQGLDADSKTFILEQFASDASLLAPLLDDNAAKLRELRAEAERTGALLTEDEAQRIKEVNDQLRLVQGSMDSLGQMIVTTFGADMVAGAEAVSGAISLVAENGELVSDVLSVGVGAWVAYKVAASDSVKSVTSAMRAQYAENLAYNGWLKAKAGLTHENVRAERLHAASMVATAGAARGLQAAMAFMTGPVGIAVLAGSLLAFSDNADAAASSTGDWSQKLNELQGNMKAVRLGQMQVDLQNVQSRIAELTEYNFWDVFSSQEERLKASEELQSAMAYVDVLKAKIADLKAEVGESPSGGSVKLKTEIEDPKGFESQRESMRGLAADYQSAFNASRTPVEQLNAELQRSYEIYMAFGNADLYDRQRQAAVDAYQKMGDDLEAKLGRDADAFAQSQMTEEQRLGVAYANRAAMIYQAHDDETISAERRDQLLLQQEELFHQQRLQLKEQADQAFLNQHLWGYQQITAFGEAYRQGDLNGMRQHGLAALQMLGQHSKGMFKIYKVAAISNAIVSAYQGISKTLATYPFPVSAAMAAAQGALAFAQVKAIKDQKFGSSTSGSSIGGSAAAPPATARGGGETSLSSGGSVSQETAPKGIARISISIGSGRVTDDEILALFERAGELHRSGAEEIDIEILRA